MIWVANHKTGMMERASVICSGDHRQQLKLFVDARRALIPESELVFAKWSGLGPVMDLTARVRALGEKLNFDLLTAQKLRSIVEIRATPLDSASKSLVARALSHSEQTAEQHYRAAFEESRRFPSGGTAGRSPETTHCRPCSSHGKGFLLNKHP